MLPAAPPPGRAYFLAGPTASGKTDAAHRLALALGCDILSADSMLVYRGLEIGVARPSPAQLREVRYWGLGLGSPGEPWTLARLRDGAGRAAAAAQGRGLVVVGGTGLYIRALIEGLDPGPPPDAALRAQWEARVRADGIGPLQREVEARHPVLFRAMSGPDTLNPRRLIRALEQGAAGITARRRGWGNGLALPPIAGLRWPPDALRARIAARVEAMYRAGFLDEVRRLAADGQAESAAARGAIGYAEALDCLAGRRTEPEARAETVRRTWQLARRQMTWFRRQAAVRWIDVAPGGSPEWIADQVAGVWAETGPIPLAV